MRKHYKTAYLKHYWMMSFLCIILSFWSTDVSAKLDVCDVTLGTYDETKTFIDSNTGSKCYIQPDGTVFIIPWGTGTYGTSRSGDIDMTIDARTDEQKAHLTGEVIIPDKVYNPDEDNKEYIVSGLARRAIANVENVAKLTIPESIKTIDSYAVDHVSQVTRGGIAYDGQFKEVDAPGVETVGYSAFDTDYNLVTINMPKVKTLYGWAFHQCGDLVSISLPELVETYPKTEGAVSDGNIYSAGPFAQCHKLENVNLPKLKNAAAGMFRECESLKELHLPEVETTGFNFIYHVSLSFRELDMPKCKELYTECVAGWDHLTKINLPNLERISPFGFGNSPIDSLVLPHLKGFTYKKNAPGGYSPYGFFALPDVKVIDLPEFTEDLSYNDFIGPRGTIGNQLRVFRIPKVKSMKAINYPPAFQNLKVLDIRGVDDIMQGGTKDQVWGYASNIDTLYCSNVSIPRKLNITLYDNYNAKYYHVANDFPGCRYVYVDHQTEEMNDSVFEHIPHIQHLVFGPDCDTKTINGVALSEIPDLQDVTIEGKGTDNVSVDGVVYSSDGKTLIAYPRANEGSTGADGNARVWQLTDEKASTLTHIAQGALRNYDRVHELRFGDNLSAIDRKAFENSHIDRVVIDANAPLTTIGNEAFRNMTETNFRYLKMPRALASIGSSAFEGDTQLQALELPCDGLTTIGDNAFAGQTAITSISLPNSVTTIGENAFKGNASMEYFTIPTSCTAIGDGAFDGCTALSVVNAPAATPVATVSFPESFKAATKLFVAENNKNNYSAWGDSFSDIITSQSVSGIRRGQFYTFSRSYPVDLNNATTMRKTMGLRFFQATGVTGENTPEGYIGVVTLKRLEGKELSAIPANTPLVIYAPKGNDVINFDYAMSVAAPQTVDSPIKGTPAAIRLDQKEDGTDNTNYLLVHPADGDYKSGEFHRVKSSEWNEVATRKGQQAYLQVSGDIASAAKAFRFSMTDATTGISSITAETSHDDSKWYDLRGLQISKPQHGVYIHGNKKVVVR